ncbi:MAG: hypothetical protein BGP13_21725 [Sphingobacteriales bacterium 40-81]|nr:MAG: hypothetical protein BGP13_21725 [Sphingobacteriales bacterium 40-81]
MRSKQLTEFKTELSELNNCLSHYIFVWEQFHIDNNEKLVKQKNKLTTEVFSQNTNSRQFRVKLDHLNASHRSTFEFILKSLFLLAYSEFEVYMRTLYEFARKADTSLPNLQVKERIPDDIFKYLGIVTSSNFDQKEIWTFDYIRLRRNRITHSGGQSKGDLADIIRNKGNALQQLWKTKLTNGLFGLNFQNNKTDTFSKEEIFDFINIFRLLTEKVDEVICQKLGEDKIIETLESEFKSKHKSEIKGWGTKRSARKFASYSKFEFDINVSNDKIEKIDFGEVA